MKKKKSAAPRRSSVKKGVPQKRSAAVRALAQKPSAPFKLREEEIERALVTGEHADWLKRYFGEQQYFEMQELARTASSRSVRGGPRVLILPGIMGSTLGSPREFFFDDVIWVDPIDIAAGALESLS